ncbi:MAG: nucleotidyl transferase AbiEii/AbiGii toxin family protein [Candidatus Marsarchaeota archaeon]|jgi:predicted nucleotidyltransferase component of viral defense system|nr:nucleotidyl transferase AbiEii/AbiGii toxin family protein [Candidatus Marsarchaeota archaeon]MCL5418461.1 nucleotidyl transferase AbiEii/AbiGii toxin family protein [Candidatus Marsarchaeota archaeon]
MISRKAKDEVSTVLDDILEYIYSDSTLPDLVLFKGGTALAKVYGINRFSKDIDLSYTGPGYGSITYQVRDFIEGSGLAVTAVSSNTIEFKIGLIRSSIDVSYLRDVINKDVNFTSVVSMAGSRYFVKAMGIEEILAEKIRAIIERREAKDLFDAYMILQKGIRCTRQYIEYKCVHSSPPFEFSRNAFIETINGWPEHRYLGQLNDYVEKSSIPPLGKVRNALNDFISALFS